MVVNHGVSEALMNSVVDGIREFFDQTDEVKLEFQRTGEPDPTRFDTSFNTSKEKTFLWRDFLKMVVDSDFQFPTKPHGLREIVQEYIQNMRKVTRGLLKAISRSLGLDESTIERAADLRSSLQVLVANVYPICPQPELTLGLKAHSDHGLLTLLIESEVGGLQIQHKGHWVNVKSIPNSLLINTGDSLEILSNGRYKSIVHRAVVNDKTERISFAVVNGPSPDMVIEPIPELVNKNNPPKYAALQYKEYIRVHQSSQHKEKAQLDRIRIQTP